MANTELFELSETVGVYGVKGATPAVGERSGQRPSHAKIYWPTGLVPRLCRSVTALARRGFREAIDLPWDLGHRRPHGRDDANVFRSFNPGALSPNPSALKP
ncbi:hypothetical protein AK812_SmicGene19923 [Symbiodinium microadriaticum]|uniref:Uncharacterized protein n=1 Tax=Symbiodinium microadriaticum TaxID=2951 RepID=A0A1Q9DRB1_SYMMI|nr:hypothetical protein AK812_SmicGene19923 [Symbiodinium microadriaticum]